MRDLEPNVILLLIDDFLLGPTFLNLGFGSRLNIIFIVNGEIFHGKVIMTGLGHQIFTFGDDCSKS